MIKNDAEGFSSLVIKSDDKVSRRQDVPEGYDLTTVAYVAKPDFILSTENLFSGRVKAFLVPKERSIDIDSKFDFTIAETIYKEGDKKC